ncbi:unnamed protein product [Amaranthus hypochondriacus]
MVSERYDSGDRKLAGDVISPENVQETDLDAYFGGFGTEISPLKMCKKAVQENVIHSFKQTSTKEIYEKWGKGICEFCNEQLEETQLSGHDCSHKEYSMLILHQGMRDELMVIVYHEKTEEADHEEDEVEVGVLGKIVDHLTDLGEQMKYNESYEGIQKREEKQIKNKSTMEKRATSTENTKKKHSKEEKIRKKKKMKDQTRSGSGCTRNRGSMKNIKKKKVRKKKNGGSNSVEAGVGEWCGENKNSSQKDWENASQTCCGSGGGPRGVREERQQRGRLVALGNQTEDEFKRQLGGRKPKREKNAGGGVSTEMVDGGITSSRLSRNILGFVGKGEMS